MAITPEDLATVRRLLADYRAKLAIQAVMSEVDYVAWKLGDISRARAHRLLVAARQDVPTADLRRRVKKTR